MTIPRLVDDLTPEWCSDALAPQDHRRRADAARRGRRPRRPAVPARARRPRGTVDGDREARGRDRREPLRRDGAQHVRPRGRLLQRALEAHDDAAPGVLLRRARPRDAGRRAAARGRVGARAHARPGRRVLGRRRPRRDPVARAAARRLLGRRLPRRPAVPAAPLRRPVSGCGRVRVRGRVAARAGVLPRADDRTGEGVRRRLRRADPRAVREAVGTAARAVARRLAARQPLRLARRRRDRGRLAADRPLGRTARPRVLRDGEHGGRGRRATTATRSTRTSAISPRTACTPTRSGRSRCTATARCSASCTR